MLRIASLLFGLVATVFAGIAITIVLMVPSFQMKISQFMMWSIGAAIILAIPVTLLIAQQIASLTRKAN